MRCIGKSQNFNPIQHKPMSKEVMISLLNRANNGNDLLAILDALIENEEDNITTDAVDFSGNPVSF